MSLAVLQVQCRLRQCIPVLKGCSPSLSQKAYHGVQLLQAEGDSRQSSHAATPKAVLLAVPGPELPRASSEQVSGVAGQLECSWSGVVWEVEGNTQRVSWFTCSGTSVTLS